MRFTYGPLRNVRDGVDAMITGGNTGAVLRAHADKTEQAERPAAESLEAIRGIGILALRTPQRHGGAWADVATVARSLTELGRACPSTAWVAGTCVTSKNLVSNYFPDKGEFFADPDALSCGSGLPLGRGEPVGDGVRLTGRWPNVSGCEDAAWAVLGLLVDGVFSIAVVSMAELSVDRTWQMAGMRGTGSHTVVAEDVLLPADQVTVASPFPLQDRLLYAMTVLGPVVGAARGALDAVEAMFASDRKPFMSTYSRMGESPGARHWLADATHLVDRAENTMLTVARTADTATLSQSDSPRLSMDLADAGRDCRAAVELMLDLHGASGFHTANVLQRYWRDVAVGSRHPHLNPYLAVERLGEALIP